MLLLVLLLELVSLAAADDLGESTLLLDVLLLDLFLLNTGLLFVSHPESDSESDAGIK